MKFIEHLKKQWGILSGAALFIIAILSTFLMDPPNYVVNEKTFSNWGKFVAAIVVGLILVAVILFREKRHTGKWFFAAIAIFVLSVGAFFTYQYLIQRWTCTCFNEDELLLIGSELRNPDNEFVKENRDDCQKLLQGNACDAERVWTKPSRDIHRLLLAGVYTLSLPFLITAMMAVVQTLYCAQRRS